MFGLTKLPAPYTDEFIGSVIIRLIARSGLTLKAVLQGLLGLPSNWMPLLYPNRLKLLAEGIGLPASEVLWKHTCYPYSLYYKTPAQVEDFEQRLLSDEHPIGPRLCGYLRSFSLPVQALRFCPACLEQEVQSQGEPYWHRAHNLPLVQTCCIHDATRLWEAPRHDGVQQYLQGLPDLRRATPLAVDLDATVAHSLALRSVAILEGVGQYSLSELDTAIRLQGYGLNRGNAGAQLSDDVRSFYGNAYLESVGCGFSDPDIAWPRRLGRRGCGTANKHALMDVFLTDGTATAPSKWKHSRVDSDSLLGGRVRRALAALVAAGKTASTQDVWSQCDSASFYERKELYPVFFDAVVDFRISQARNRPGPATKESLQRRTPATRSKSRIHRDDFGYAKLLQEAIDDVRSTGERTSVRELLKKIGIRRQFSLEPSRYPQVAKLVGRFRSSLNSRRSNVSPRSR